MANSAQRAALEKKALAAPSKSEGMRMLLNAGYTVGEVRDVFGAPYGFVYGVAVRNGNITSTPRTPKAKATKTAAKAPAKAAAKAPARQTKAARPAAKTPARSSRRPTARTARARG